VQTSAFQNAVDNIGELATKYPRPLYLTLSQPQDTHLKLFRLIRSESTIAAIQEQHTKLSSLQNELLGSVERVAEFQRSILGAALIQALLRRCTH
jgi:hypothetical protein